MIAESRLDPQGVRREVGVPLHWLVERNLVEPGRYLVPLVPKRAPDARGVAGKVLVQHGHNCKLCIARLACLFGHLLESYQIAPLGIERSEWDPESLTERPYDMATNRALFDK